MKAILYDICEMLEDELKDIVKKGDISPSELESTYKAVDIIKDIKTIEAMSEGGYSEDDGMSGRRGRRNSYDGGSSSRGSYDGGSSGRGSYDGSYDGMSGARRRYSRDEGYSGTDDKEQMLKKIEQMKKQIEQMS